MINSSSKNDKKESNDLPSWPVELGDYRLGKGHHVAIAEIECSMDIPEDRYAIKGKIVTPNLGVVRAVRNLVANPNLRYLVLTGSTVPGFMPGQALLSLKAQGVDEENRIKGAKGYRPFVRGLSGEEISTFRERIRILDLRGQSEAQVIEEIKALPTPDPEDLVPIQRQMPERTLKVQQFERDTIFVGGYIKRTTPSALWPAVLRHIWLYGEVNDSERGEVRETLALTAKVAEPLNDLYFPEYPMPQKELERYGEHFLQSERKTASYTYGDRLHNVGNMDAVLDYLRDHKTTRRGIITLWNPEVDVGSTSPPCFIHTQFFIRDETLHLIAYWRSQDMFGAAPANWYGLSHMMEKIANELGVTVGPWTTFTASAHLYKSDWGKVTNVIGEFPRELKVRPRLFNSDELGYFLIRLGETIEVEHRNALNQLLYRLTGENAEKISREIAHLSPNLNSQHLLYLGRELMKAEIALKTDGTYTQDKRLDL